MIRDPLQDRLPDDAQLGLADAIEWHARLRAIAQDDLDAVEALMMDEGHPDIARALLGNAKRLVATVERLDARIETLQLLERAAR
jgi:hypothetical protein